MTLEAYKMPLYELFRNDEDALEVGEVLFRFDICKK